MVAEAQQQQVVRWLTLDVRMTPHRLAALSPWESKAESMMNVDNASTTGWVRLR